MMNYKETLLFVAKCLTINHEHHNKIIVENLLKNNTVNWDSVVKVSTGHYVFPALYINFKKADFLQYIPADLVEYMEHITDLNRERNQQIIEQSNEINALLLRHNITPIFLKGTANLLEGLYDDVAERMIGDIDIIIDKKNLYKADEILKENAYKATYIMFDDYRHLPRLTKDNKIAAIELHGEFLDNPYRENFNYTHVEKSIKKVDNFFVLDAIDSTAFNIFSIQITDGGHAKGNISLRKYYDYFLKTRNVDVEKVIEKYSNYGKIIISYDYVYSVFFNINFNYSKENLNLSKKYYRKVFNNFKDKSSFKIMYKIKSFGVYISLVFPIIMKAFYSKSNFKFVVSRITSKDWYKRKFLGI